MLYCRMVRHFDFLSHNLVRPLSAAPAFLILVLYFDCLYSSLSSAQDGVAQQPRRMFRLAILILVRQLNNQVNDLQAGACSQ